MRSSPLDPSYRQLLLDFRIDIFRHLTIVMAIFCILAAFTLVFTKPLPHQLVFLLYIYSGFALGLRRLGRNHSNLARYLFVGSLYAGLATAMILLPVSWLPFLIFPLLFISGLLVSHINIVLTILFFAYTTLLTHVGFAEYPLQPLALFLFLMLTITDRGITAFNTMLLWYSTTYQQTNRLLQETRNHRAELVQLLKSLEMAYDTQRRLQTQLMYARQQAEEARRMKDRFASNISHELRTPLNIILGFTEIMHVTPEVYGEVLFPPKLQRDIYQIHRNSRHLLEMIDDVMDLSHVEMSQFSLNFEPTDLSLYLNETIEIISNLFRGKSVEFIVSIANNLPEIEIDRTRIRQVIINLLNNAQRFTPSGSVTFSVEQKGREVIFEVADTGMGIPEDKLNLIFEEFYQVDFSLSRAHGGAGLGLAITKRFVEAHNGHIQVMSTEGHGSVFTFALPISSQHSYDTRELHPITPPKAVPVDSLWLVADADAHITNLITRHAEGRRIIQVADDRLIHEAIQQHSPQGLIINNSPDYPVPQHLIDLPIPTIVCSLPSTTQMLRKLHVDACLSKPVRPAQILEQFQRYDQLRKVLVVDDDVGVVQLVQRSIETQYPGIEVQRAYNGRQALEVMRQHPPDLVLLDLAMGDISGFDVIEAMHGDPKLAYISVILLTATRYIYSDEETCAGLSIHQAGGLRPMSVLQLIPAIMHTLEKPGHVLLH